VRNYEMDSMTRSYYTVKRVPPWGVRYGSVEPPEETVQRNACGRQDYADRNTAVNLGIATCFSKPAKLLILTPVKQTVNMLVVIREPLKNLVFVEGDQW
jgi:hypothetical protein